MPEVKRRSGPPPAPVNGKAKAPGKPKLVNRGSSGLLNKLTDEDRKRIVPREGVAPVKEPVRAKYQIAPGLKHLAVAIDSVTLDPDNARIHPDRNIEAIKESLLSFGQVKPVVVRKQTGVVVAGNGTTECARQLGWKQIAAVFIEMSDAEAAAYGLADNKTAMLAQWDHEVVGRLDRMIQEAGYSMAGWSTDELEVLRAADWLEPAVSDKVFGADDPDGPAVLRINQEERRIFDVTVGVAKTRTGDKKLTDGQILVMICNAYMGVETSDGGADADSGSGEEEQDAE